MTSPTTHSERRRASRAAATFPVQLSAKADGEPALLRDLSEIGLACTSSQAIPEMTQVSLDFALPGATERHKVDGAIVRCAPIRSSGATKQWDIAVYFTSMQPVTRAALRNYVQKGKKV